MLVYKYDCIVGRRLVNRYVWHQTAYTSLGGTVFGVKRLSPVLVVLCLASNGRHLSGWYCVWRQTAVTTMCMVSVAVLVRTWTQLSNMLHYLFYKIVNHNSLI